LLGKMNQSKMATDLEKREEGEQFRVMDEPNLPESPVFPKRGLFVIGGLVAGIAFGLILVAGIEYKDKSLRTEKDIWFFTKLHTLGQNSQIDIPQPRSSSRSLWGRVFHSKPEVESQA